jgi:hypothetical protein
MMTILGEHPIVSGKEIFEKDSNLLLLTKAYQLSHYIMTVVSIAIAPCHTKSLA